MNIESPKRTYRQSARAKAAEATGERILDAFAQRLAETWFDEITLDEIAAEAGVTVQTVIRRFGGKDGLLAAVHDRINPEIRKRREVSPGDANAAISALVLDYEAIGEFVLRFLAQEDRYKAMKDITDSGRVLHRQWMELAFAPWLQAMTEEQRRAAVDALAVAGNIYVWKLVRKDLGRTVGDYRAMVEKLCAAAIGADPSTIFSQNKGRP